MEHALNELKICAKKLRKKMKSGEFPPYLARHRAALSEAKLTTYHAFLARETGFRDWRQAQHILSGKLEVGSGTDFAGFWHAQGCDGLLNHWFSDYPAARKALTAGPDLYLFPFRRQFAVAGGAYCRLLGIDNQPADLWAAVKRDLVAGYGSAAWDQLALACMRHKLTKLREKAPAPTGDMPESETSR